MPYRRACKIFQAEEPFSEQAGTSRSEISADENRGGKTVGQEFGAKELEQNDPIYKRRTYLGFGQGKFEK